MMAIMIAVDNTLGEEKRNTMVLDILNNNLDSFIENGFKYSVDKLSNSAWFVIEAE